jgi:hypothetical protein
MLPGKHEGALTRASAIWCDDGMVSDFPEGRVHGWLPRGMESGGGFVDP